MHFNQNKLIQISERTKEMATNSEDFFCTKEKYKKCVFSSRINIDLSLLFKTLWTVRKLTWTTTHEKNQGHCNSWKIVANGHSGWCFMWTFFDWPTNYSHELHFYLRNGSLFIHSLKLFCSLLCRRVLQKTFFVCL